MVSIFHHEADELAGRRSPEFGGIVFLLDHAGLAINHHPGGGHVFLGISEVTLVVEADEETAVGELARIDLHERAVKEQNVILET